MPDKDTSWNHEFRNHRPIEDQQPVVSLPTTPKTMVVNDLRVEVKKVAMDYFFRQSRHVPEGLVQSSPVTMICEVLEDVLTYSEPGSRHVLLFHESDAQIFVVNSQGSSPGLVGYYRAKGLFAGTPTALYQLFIVEGGYGMLEPVLVDHSI